MEFTRATDVCAILQYMASLGLPAYQPADNLLFLPQEMIVLLVTRQIDVSARKPFQLLIRNWKRQPLHHPLLIKGAEPRARNDSRRDVSLRHPRLGCPLKRKCCWRTVDSPAAADRVFRASRLKRLASENEADPANLHPGGKFLPPTHR
jgi:hypothetical protein